jgi:ParB family chromosome partitioning protein
MAGKRVNLSSLAAGKVEAVPGASRPTLVHVPPAAVAPTPLNPRVDFDKASLLELGQSMKGGQLAPCIAITRARYVELFPEHAEELPECTYVMAAGERRWKAALEVGLATLDLHVRQDIGESRVKFLAAVLAENIERRNFNFIEEAQGLQRMLEMSGGNQTEAARQLSKSKQWLSQRLGILRLSPAMQEAVLAGELTAFRDMRKYAALPADQQLAAWQADRKAAEERRTDPPAEPPRDTPPAAAPAPAPAGPAREEEPPAVYTAVYTPTAEAPTLGATPTTLPPTTPVGAPRQAETVSVAPQGSADRPLPHQQDRAVTARPQGPAAPPVSAAAPMDLTDLPGPERSQILHQYISSCGNVPKLVEDLERGLNAPHRERLARILGDVAALMLSRVGTP